MLYSQVKQPHSKYRNHTEERTPTKEVFQSFRTGCSKDISGNFTTKFKKKNREIKRLINSNLGFDNKLSRALETLREGMGKYLFGPNGTLSSKLALLASFAERRDHELKRDFSKIEVGDLVYLDLSDHAKTSQDNRIKEIKKMCLRRSVHFNVTEGNNYSFHFKRKKTKLNTKSFHAKSLSALQRPYTYNSQNTSYTFLSNQFNSSKDKFNELNEENLRPLSNPKQRKGHSSKPKSKLHIKLKKDTSHFYNRNLSSTQYDITPQHYNGSNDRLIDLSQPSRPLSSVIIKEIKLKRKLLEDQIKNMSTEHNIAEKELFTMLDNDRNSPNKFKQVFSRSKSPMVGKIEKDAELIFDVKLKKKGKKTFTKDLLQEAANIKKDEECKKAILRLSDGITKMNNDTALKFADNIIQEYMRKTQTKFDFSLLKKEKRKEDTKVNIDLKLRDKANENYSRIQRMLFAYDKTKKKLKIDNLSSKKKPSFQK